MIAIDTNILVYAFDITSLKHSQCAQLVEGIMTGKQQGAVTNQILAEFSDVITRKVKNPFSSDEARRIIDSILRSRNWTVLDYTGKTVSNALGVQGHFWDLLIVQTLRENGLKAIVTENVKDFIGSGLEVLSVRDFTKSTGG
ncbi:MAG: PIN domain-containing protein [Candidatus Woesearchaeota archaeon]